MLRLIYLFVGVLFLSLGFTGFCTEIKDPIEVNGINPISNSDNFTDTLKKAEQGDVEAQYNLGWIMIEDKDKSIEWFRKSAEQGHVKSKCILISIKEPNAITSEDKNTIELLAKIAKQGEADSQFILGMMYNYGCGVPKDTKEGIMWLTKAAEQGYDKAQAELGDVYIDGEGVPQDYKEAAKWYTKAAEQGYNKAQCKLGEMYLYGQGVSIDGKSAIKWYEKAAKQGDYSVIYRLGDIYESGTGVPIDGKMAVKWYTMAAEHGDQNAQFRLGLMYFDGQRVSKDYKEAFKWFTKAAGQEYYQAQYHLGLMYENGWGVPKDYKEAFNWFIKAAEQGDTKSQYSLGLMYLNGQHVLKDYKEAFKWFTKAAENGYGEAQYHLGLMYDNGWGVPKDENEAVKWYTEAKEDKQSVAKAQYELGSMYYEGYIMSQDYKEAFKLFSKAAEQGHTGAQFMMGCMYFHGEGVLQDYEMAVKWFKTASEQGQAEAQCNFGTMYLLGQGVPEDYIEAYKWLNLSAAQGNELAAKKREILKEKMSPEQIAEAQRLSREFKPKIQGQFASDDQTLKESEIKGNGTGFFITTDGYLLTAYHVINDASKIQVWTGKGLSPAKVIRVDSANDIALLKVDGARFEALAIKSSRDAKVGQEVFTLGFPNIQLQGTEAKYTQGNISSLSGIADDPRLFQISAAVQPGNSGGPLLNAEGQVVGLIVAKLDEIATAKETGSLPQNVNYALKSSFVLSFLESIPDLSEKLKKPVGMNKAEAIERAKQAVAIIVCTL